MWAAISDLFLDTEPDDNDFEYIATVLAESPYSTSDLKAILTDEVAPVLRWNFLQVAGEWVGFDSQWLEEQILQRASNRRWFRWNWGARLIKEHWQIVLDRVDQKRNTSDAKVV